MESRHVEAQQPLGVIDRCGSWLRTVICGMHGHDLLLSFEPNRLCLRCVSCSYESHGWVLKDSDPRLTGASGRRRPVLIEESAR